MIPPFVVEYKTSQEAPASPQMEEILMIDTEMNAEFDEEDLALIKEEIPADYIASPKEAAQMVYHVATSPAYMTGQVITFSGGWY